MKKKILIGVGVFLGVCLLGVVMIVSTVIGQRNKMVTADELIESSWAQVDNVLQRRADLIPNLVATVKGIAQQEKDVFIQVAKARSQVAGAGSRKEQIAANQQMSGALSRLMLVVERYPELKSNQNFLALQDQLEGAENRIAVERKRYNEAVRNFNILVRRFPGSLVAGFFGMSKRDEYFEAAPESKTVPKVQF